MTHSSRVVFLLAAPCIRRVSTKHKHRAARRIAWMTVASFTVACLEIAQIQLDGPRNVLLRSLALSQAGHRGYGRFLHDRRGTVVGLPVRQLRRFTLSCGAMDSLPLLDYSLLRLLPLYRGLMRRRHCLLGPLPVLLVDPSDALIVVLCSLL